MLENGCMYCGFNISTLEYTGAPQKLEYHGKVFFTMIFSIYLLFMIGKCQNINFCTQYLVRAYERDRETAVNLKKNRKIQHVQLFF